MDMARVDVAVGCLICDGGCGCGFAFALDAGLFAARGEMMVGEDERPQSDGNDKQNRRCINPCLDDDTPIAYRIVVIHSTLSARWMSSRFEGIHAVLRKRG